MDIKKTILITGAGSGIAEGVSIGLAKLGHHVIAGVQISPQVTALRLKVKELGLEDNLHVEKLDILDPFDMNNALKWDIDILLNHAGIGEAGPVSEIPLVLVQTNFETNVFAPLALSQKFIAKWVNEHKKGKIAFTSSLLGLFDIRGFGAYEATKHALEAIAEEMHFEMKPHGIQVQVFNPGPFLTGFNERMEETAFKWLDDRKNFMKRAELRAQFEKELSISSELDPQICIDAMIEILPQDTGKFRNIIPENLLDQVVQASIDAWNLEL
jgi:NAD(P)-dependent dehydrogenase (short-subunit alcohol dehydrogenase family)